MLLVAGWFLVFAWNRSGSAVADSYELVARFPNVTGVSVGTDVRVSGMKVGRVVAQELDPKTWQAVVRMAIDRRVSLPVDSSAAITSEGLLGGSFIALMPGGEEEKLALLRGADVALNPISSGSGTNLKMLEYFAAGLPVLSTPHG
ncbi:MAG: MlaD family protein, partial [Thermaurantiacus tibetensis]